MKNPVVESPCQADRSASRSVPADVLDAVDRQATETREREEARLKRLAEYEAEKRARAAARPPRAAVAHEVDFIFRWAEAFRAGGGFERSNGEPVWVWHRLQLFADGSILVVAPHNPCMTPRFRFYTRDEFVSRCPNMAYDIAAFLRIDGGWSYLRGDWGRHQRRKAEASRAWAEARDAAKAAHDNIKAMEKKAAEAQAAVEAAKAAALAAEAALEAAAVVVDELDELDAGGFVGASA